MAAPSVASQKIKKADTGRIVGKETIPVIQICKPELRNVNSFTRSKALLMLAPSVVTPQNQYFPANAERMSVHCLESGCIGKYIPPLSSVQIHYHAIPCNTMQYRKI